MTEVIEVAVPESVLSLRRIGVCVALAVLSTLCACRGPGRGSEPTPVPAPQPPGPRGLGGSPLVDKSLVEVTGRAVTAWDRGAIIVVADKYSTLPESYNLPGLGAGARSLHETLRDGCGMPEEAITTLTGTDAIPQQIERAIREFAERVRGRAVLTLFFCGHGVVDSDGQLQFFTHFTDKQDTRYTNTLPRTTLLGWLSAARKRAGERSASLETVLVADACRTPTLGAPPPAKLIREETWEIYSTADGASADAPRGGNSPFVDAIVKTFATAGPEAATSLQGVFSEIRRHMSENGSRQTPQFVGPQEQEGPRISQRNRVRVGLLVRDDLSDTPVQVAEGGVLVDRAPAVADGDVFMLETTPDNLVRLEVTAPGYLPFSRSVSFARRQNGKTFAVELRPSFTRIVGRVSPPVSVQVLAGSDQVKPREGYHEMAAQTTSDDGAFQLRVPALGPGVEMQIVLQQNGRELSVVPVPADRLEPDAQETGATRVDLGTLALTNADTTALQPTVDLKVLEEKRRAFDDDSLGGIKLPVAYGKPDFKQTPRFSDRYQESDWNAALRSIEVDDLVAARGHLRRVMANMAAPDVTVRTVVGHVDLALALRAESDAAVAQAAAEAEAHDPLLAAGLRAVLAARKLFRASQLVQRSDPAVVDLLEEARQLEPPGVTPYGRATQQRIRELRWSIAAKLLDNLNADGRHAEYLAAMERLLVKDPDFHDAARDQRTIVALIQRMREALEEGKGERGDWQAADEAIALRRRVFPTRVPEALQDLEIEIAKERIPSETRGAWKAAEAARVAGDVDAATRHYLAARPSANDHYRALIDARLAEMREGAYTTNIAEADRLRRTDDKRGALVAYLRASAARGQVLGDVQQILRATPALADDPAVRDLLSTLDRQCLAAAQTARSPRVWQKYIEDFPAGAGLAEAKEALARAETPWRVVAENKGTPALARFGHVLVFDEARGQVLMFGGASATPDGTLHYLNDTWTFDGAQWRCIEPPTRPPARAFAAAAYDRDRGVTVLFGGTADADYTGMNDTWVFDGVTWTAVGQVGVSPPARSEHAMAFDQKRGRTVLYGGRKRHKDTWEWDGERWIVVNSKNSPSTRLSPAMAFAPGVDKVMLVGGDGRDRETWMWDGATWTDTKGEVEHVDGGTLAVAGSRLLRFGGVARAPVADIAAWTAGAWKILTLGKAPPPRTYHGAAFDPRRGVLVVHGGMVPGRRGRPERVFGDTWELWIE